MPREQFLEVVKKAILSLPSTLKTVLRIAEDPEVPDEGRSLATGALLHWLSAANTIPGIRGLLSYVDDVLIIRFALEELESLEPEVTARYRAESPELLESLGDDLNVIRSYLGNAAAVLESATAGIRKIRYKGYSVEQCMFDDESVNWLYEEIQSSLIELDLEEEEVSRVLNKGIDSIINTLNKRVGATR
jgi:uncharacterized membrane protein YkvA (DUF1232 family)